MKRYCYDSSEYDYSHRIKRKRCLDARTLFKSVE